MAHPENKGIARFREERDRFFSLYELSQQSNDPDTRLSGAFAKLMGEARGRIVGAYDAGEPFIAGNYATAPEVAVAMDLPWYMLYESAFMAHEEMDAAMAAMGVSADICATHRSAMYYLEHDLVPAPTAAIGLLFPCDGMPMLHQVIKHHRHWRDVPMFSPDPPYFNDHRAVSYFAAELRKMAAFLERVTGRTLDLDRLKAVIVEGEKQYALWREYVELRRAVPCPDGFAQGGSKCFFVSQVLQVGQPDGTTWFATLLENAERKVATGIGAAQPEKIRLFWFDIVPTTWASDFMPWLEREWGAVMVMDMFSNHAYSPIDTSNEERMWQGLARRGLFETAMMRQATGTAEARVEDLVRIVKDYQIDAVVWPGHMGHKESLALYGIVRETCRELGVPILELRMDMFDKRYTTPDEIKDKFSKFFRAMDLG